MSIFEWFEDLFGGRDKIYFDNNDNEVRLSQDADMWTENEGRGKGDYPHMTYNHDGGDCYLGQLLYQYLAYISTSPQLHISYLF